MEDKKLFFFFIFLSFIIGYVFSFVVLVDDYCDFEFVGDMSDFNKCVNTCREAGLYDSFCSDFCDDFEVNFSNFEIGVDGELVG